MGKDAASRQKAGTAVATCPLKVCTVVVQVYRMDEEKLSTPASIDVQGPSAANGKTEPGTQRRTFKKLTPCDSADETYVVSIQPGGKEAKFSIVSDPSNATMSIPGGATGTFVFELSAASWIKFRIIYDKPPPDQKAEISDVRLFVKRPIKPPFAWVTTDLDGMGRVSGLDAGTCNIDEMNYESCVLEVVGEVESS